MWFNEMDDATIRFADKRFAEVREKFSQIRAGISVLCDRGPLKTFWLIPSSGDEIDVQFIGKLRRVKLSCFRRGSDFYGLIEAGYTDPDQGKFNSDISIVMDRRGIFWKEGVEFNEENQLGSLLDNREDCVLALLTATKDKVQVPNQ